MTNILNAFVPGIKLINFFLTIKLFFLELSSNEILKAGEKILYPLRIFKIDVNELSKVLLVSITLVNKVLEEPGLKYEYNKNKGFTGSLINYVERIYVYCADFLKSGKINTGYNLFSFSYNSRSVKLLLYTLIIAVVWYYAEYKMYSPI